MLDSRLSSSFESFPGGDLVREGIADLEREVESVAALLVSIGAPRLRRIGFAVPEPAIPSPELRLYERLAESDPDSRPLQRPRSTARQLRERGRMRRR